MTSTDASSPNAQVAGQLATITATEALERLVTSHNGLAPAEASARLRRLGPNSLPRARRSRWWIVLASNFFHLFAILLWIAALLAWLAGMPQLMIAIGLVVII